ncbi:hypothetical protein, partial [Yersinia pestis]|uniref:hypothetical protein n=1 Tax=Yersinia pestis TaxID=632 RepID=UPI001ED9B3E9
KKKKKTSPPLAFLIYFLFHHEVFYTHRPSRCRGVSCPDCLTATRIILGIDALFIQNKHQALA